MTTTRVRMTAKNEQLQRKKQIPRGNDRKNGNSKSHCRSLRCASQKRRRDASVEMTGLRREGWNKRDGQRIWGFAGRCGWWMGGLGGDELFVGFDLVGDFGGGEGGLVVLQEAPGAGGEDGGEDEALGGLPGSGYVYRDQVGG